MHDNSNQFTDPHHGLLQTLMQYCKRIFSPTVLFVLILVIGIFARIREYPHLPPGLNQDEATIGIEAYDLLHYGVDRNGIPYPVNFVSWGNGMDALYGYILIPFVSFGLTPLTVRLPALLAGILTLPLIYFIGKRTSGATFGLSSMFLLAISPWHILMSRWGINENILPFVFSLGFACLLLTGKGNAWFWAAAGFFGLCLYAYGATYVAVPIFMSCAVVILIRSNQIRKKDLLIGLAIFSALALPVFLFVLVNVMGLNDTHIGPFTIPRLPVQARFLDMSATSQTNPAFTMLNNIRGLVKLLLVYQSDQQLWNSVEPFGYMFAFSFPLAVIGAILMFPTHNSTHSPERLLLLSWLLASMMIGVFQYPNINRIHLVFIPIILCIAYFLMWLGEKNQFALSAMVVIYLTSFIIFTNVYHGETYRKQAERVFYAGLIPALADAQQYSDNPICVTDRVNMPYIYTVFIEKPDPAIFAELVNYKYPDLRSGEVVSYGRYTFGVENCPEDARTIYILTRDEKLPDKGRAYDVKEFNQFQVYYP